MHWVCWLLVLLLLVLGPLYAALRFGVWIFRKVFLWD